MFIEGREGTPQGLGWRGLLRRDERQRRESKVHFVPNFFPKGFYFSLLAFISLGKGNVSTFASGSTPFPEQEVENGSVPVPDSRMGPWTHPSVPVS